MGGVDNPLVIIVRLRDELGGVPGGLRGGCVGAAVGGGGDGDPGHGSELVSEDGGVSEECLHLRQDGFGSRRVRVSRS